MERSASFLLHNALAIVTVMTAIVSAGGCSGHGADAPGDDGGSSAPTKTCADACAACRLQNICSDCNYASRQMRDEFEAVLYPCVTQMDACSNGWTACANQGIAAISTRNIDMAYRRACEGKRADCASQGASFPDDFCLQSSPFIAEAVSAAQQCLTKVCTEVPACIRAAFI